MKWIVFKCLFICLLSQLEANTEIESDFTGENPSQNLPWIATSTLNNSFEFSGWSMGEGLDTLDGDDSFVFYAKAGSELTTLEEALNTDSYLSCSISVREASFDFSGAQINLQLSRHSWHAALQFAVFTSVDGFELGDEVYKSEVFSNHDEDSHILSFFLPQSGYEITDETLEIRLVPYQVLYHHKETRLEAFSIVSGMTLYELNLNSELGGRISSVPDRLLYEEGTIAVLSAEPHESYRFAGWSGAIEGMGNPRHIRMDTDKNVSAHFERVPSASMEIGQNLNGVSDWTSSFVFKDILRRTRTWMTRDAVNPTTWSTDYSSYIPLDENGWPTEVPFDPGDTAVPQIVHSILVQGNEAGEYTFSFEGTGSFDLRVEGTSGDYHFEGDGTVQNHPITMIHQGMVALTIKESGPAPNHLKNFHLVSNESLSNFEEEPFDPVFVEKSSGFNLLRFMDWGRTNASPTVEWSERTTLNSNTQTKAAGVAIELMLELCNLQESDAWICIPHRASDDYVRQAALLIQEQLDPKLKVYIEYSNELWNSGFEQNAYVQEQGLAFGLADESWVAGWRYTSLRSVEIWKIFAEVFAEEAETRVVNVLATQSANTTVSNHLIDAMNDPEINPDAIYADVLAIAPYFGETYSTSELPPNVEAYPSVEEVAGSLSIDSIERVKSHVQNHKALANKQGMKLVCYEGGQHFVGLYAAQNDDTLTAILMEANRSEAMYDRYIEYLDMLEQNGVEVFANFTLCGNWSKYGYWGLLESIDQDIDLSPKYRAMKDWMELREGENALNIHRIYIENKDVELSWSSNLDQQYSIETSEDMLEWNLVKESIPSGGNETINILKDIIGETNSAIYFRVTEEL